MKNRLCLSVTYTPKTYNGTYAEDIFSEVLFANRTVSRNLARVLDDIKYSQTVTSLTGDISFGDYVEHVTEAVITAASNTLAFKDANVTPVKMTAFETFSMLDLRNSRFGRDMKSGAANVESNEFEQKVQSYVLPRLGKSFESTFYNSITAATKTAIAASSATTAQKAWAAAQTAGKIDGVIAKAILSGAILAVAGTTVTASNIVTEYNKIMAALPSAVASDSETKLLVPEGDRMLILQANQAAAYRDVFAVNGLGSESESVSFLGVPVEFTGINARIAGRVGERGDVILATDLLSDVNSATIGKVNEMSHLMFFRMDCALDAAVLVPQQKVLYV